MRRRSSGRRARVLARLGMRATQHIGQALHELGAREDLRTAGVSSARGQLSLNVRTEPDDGHGGNLLRHRTDEHERIVRGEIQIHDHHVSRRLVQPLGNVDWIAEQRDGYALLFRRGFDLRPEPQVIDDQEDCHAGSIVYDTR